MKFLPSSIRSVVGSSAIAMAVTLSLGWPSAVNAVGGEEEAALQQGEIAQAQGAPTSETLERNEAKVGDLYVSASLETSESAKATKVIRLECENPTNSKISGKVKVSLTRTSGSGMERVMPRPQIAWTHVESVELAPGEKLLREVVLPKNVGAEVLRIERLYEKAGNSDNVRAPNVYYGAQAEAVESAAKAPVKTARKTFSKLPVVTMLPRSNKSSALALEMGY